MNIYSTTNSPIDIIEPSVLLPASHDAGAAIATKTIAICGANSFAAQGLTEELRQQGHRVFTFGRCRSEDPQHVSAPVSEFAEVAGFPTQVDVVVNFIFLQGRSVEENLDFVKSLVTFCRDHEVQHLVHISSCSVYKNSTKNVDEDAAIETDPRKKGPYAAIKAATEDYLLKHKPDSLKVSSIRPGLILGTGIKGYMGGIGFRMPWNSVLGVGSARSQLPLVTRAALTASIRRVIEKPPQDSYEVLLLADSNSPTRRQYLQACCEALGSGNRVHCVPKPLWLMAAFAGEVGSRLIGKGHLNILSKVASVCRFQRFNACQTEERVGFSFARDWREELKLALDHQPQNYQIPAVATADPVNAKSIAYLGYGRIVKTRHLPALKKLRFKGEIRAYDLFAKTDEDTRQEVQDISQDICDSSDLYVVASPGPAHINALDQLAGCRGPILIEKPLCYSNDELGRWIEFARGRPDPVYVCHNSLYRPNVLKMFAFMQRFNPGQLHHVRVDFQSPPVIHDSALWLRDERSSSTLLLDYGLHSMHLASMFGTGDPVLRSCRHELDSRRHTSLIQGEAQFDNHSVSFLLRQGFLARRMRVDYHFQNYTLRLGFSPDTFVPHMTNDNFGTSWLESRAAVGATAAKVISKLTGRDRDDSHARVISAAFSRSTDVPLTTQQLVPTYKLLLQVNQHVYSA